MRLALVGACLVLVGALGAACGGDDGGGDDATTNADKGEFCEAWKGASEAVMENSDDFDAIKSAYQDAFDVGTPEDMPGDARDGYEVMRDAIDEVDSKEELEDMEEPSEGDSEKVDKFTEYLSKECADELSPDSPEESEGSGSEE